ncbi:MAG TPA: TetR family transcriptional regulator [Usitatibacter sp.]|nr:TetR family transcriptional regulator [Usitatibacter sp.]
MRRTKEEAARTRDAIVEAALACFDRHGIANTTLEQIATEASVTKGAVYWHFSGKHEILHAIREEVSLPLLDRADCTLLARGERAPLDRVARFLEGMLESVESDPRTRRALTVMQFKCEYADELVQGLDDMHRNNDRLAKALEATYEEARKAGTLNRALTPRIAALDTTAFLAGLVRLSLLDRTRNGMRKNTPALIRAHVASRRAA